MVLDYFEGKNFTPQSWEELCDSCYSLRYPGRWHKVPAAYLGDCGIEGYTDDGIVYQCYYPEQEYSNDELYSHQRDKLTTDISKIISPNNIEKLKSVLGRVIINEWHLVVPTYKDRRIIVHANNKENEIIEIIKTDPSKYTHISKNIKISIMQADCFIEEISKTIRFRNSKIKLRIEEKDINYSSCDADKVDNLKRKLKAIQPNANEIELNKLVDLYIKLYLNGIERLNKLRIDLPTEYKDLHDILIAYTTDVTIKTELNSDSSLNKQVFDEIMKEFQEELEKLSIFDQSTVKDLKNEIIAGWLADCPMEFKS